MMPVVGAVNGVEETERHGSVDPGDDRGIKKRPGWSRLGRDGVVEMVQKGVLAYEHTEEVAPLVMNAGVER
jgi:hypothetical protein